MGLRLAAAIAVLAACGQDGPCERGSPPHLELWAVGPSGTIWHRTSGRWSPSDSPTAADLHAVWGSARDDVWAVGAGGTAIHFDGNTWTAVPTGVQVALRGVAGSAADDVWGAGDGGALIHWDGTAWSPFESGTTEDLLAVWASGREIAFAGGPTGGVLRWDGASWHFDRVSTRPLRIRGFDGPSATDLWAVGEESRECVACVVDECSDCLNDLILHRIASGWTEDSVVTDGGSSIFAIAAPGNEGVWVAAQTCGEGWSILRRRPGEDWVTESLGSERRGAIWGARADAMWAAGDGILTRSGSAWRAEGGPGRVDALWGPAASLGEGQSVLCDIEVAAAPRFAVSSSPCQDVTCDGALCDSLEGVAACECAAGLHDEDHACVPDEPCTGVTCSGLGSCVEVDGGPHCDCEGNLVSHGGTACGVPAVAGACSADGWCIEGPFPLAGVTGLWASGPDEVWAIGDNGRVARRGATGWEPLDLGISGGLLAIDGSGPDDVWLVTQQTLYHWDGTSTAEVQVSCSFGTHAPSLMTDLHRVVVAGPGDVWVTGLRAVDMQLTEGTCRFDGERWQPVLFDWDAAGDLECGGMSCADVVSTGTGALWCDFWRWDGSTLAPEREFPWGATDVWGTEDDAWIVATEGRLWHWDGSDAELAGIDAYEVDGAATDDVWGLGSSLWHFDGVSWVAVDTMADPSGAHVAALAGGRAIVSVSGGLYLYTLEGRTEESSPLRLGGAAVWAASPDDLWIGGATLQHFDGESWTTSAEVPELGTVIDLVGFASDDIWALGQGGLAHFDGMWTMVSLMQIDLGEPVSERTVELLSGAASDDVWIAGRQVPESDRGPSRFIAHWDGASWSSIPRQESRDASAMWAAPRHLWIGTRGGTLERWNGTEWRSFDRVTEDPVTALFGTAGDDEWAASSSRTYHWDSHSWQEVPSGLPDGTIHSMWGSASNDVWAIGGRDLDGRQDGFVLHWNGSAWAQESLPAVEGLRDVHGAGDRVWAVGRYLVTRQLR